MERNVVERNEIRLMWDDVTISARISKLIFVFKKPHRVTDGMFKGIIWVSCVRRGEREALQLDIVLRKPPLEKPHSEDYEVFYGQQ